MPEKLPLDLSKSLCGISWIPLFRISFPPHGRDGCEHLPSGTFSQKTNLESDLLVCRYVTRFVGLKMFFE